MSDPIQLPGAGTVFAGEGLWEHSTSPRGTQAGASALPGCLCGWQAEGDRTGREGRLGSGCSLAAAFFLFNAI